MGRMASISEFVGNVAHQTRYSSNVGINLQKLPVILGFKPACHANEPVQIHCRKPATETFNLLRHQPCVRS